MLFKVLDHLLLRSVELDLQAGCGDKAIGFRRGHQGVEANAALHMVVCHDREYGTPLPLAKFDLTAAFGKIQIV